jgi:cystathionine beta-lyase/cystathionine gamma-synthase
MMDPLDLSSLSYEIATIGIHADDGLAPCTDVAPPLHVSTTYRYTNDAAMLKNSHEVTEYARTDVVYSRVSQRNVLRAELILGEILKGHAVLYASGLSAFHGALLHYNPKNVFIGGGYHGSHSLLKILQRNYGIKVHSLDGDPEILQPGDVVHVETPVNPTGESLNLEHYAKIAHSRGAYLVVDATFSPPPLQDPFEHGADMVMHSATKYFGGHSDLLAGVLATKDPEVAKSLMSDRDVTGTITASMESWLLLRSLRTFKFRIRVQNENANRIVKYLVDHIKDLPLLTKVYHSSLQSDDFVKNQLPHGGPPVFSIEVTDKEVARRLPSRLKLFQHATSLGGVESLIEWRSMSDKDVIENLLRVSVGVEDAEDLIKDLHQALSRH